VSVAYRLDAVCDIVMGQAPPGTSYNVDGQGLPLIAGAGDFDGIHPKTTKFTTEPGKTCSKGDLVLAIRATIGDTVVADRDYCLGRGVAGLRPRPSLDARYLWHWLAATVPTLNAKAKGATFKQVNREDIGGLVISLPDPSEQRRIAAILDQADALRNKRRAALAQLDTLAESIFIDMFGDPATNPKGWPVLPFGQLGENEDSRRVPLNASERRGRQGKYAYYGASGIVDWIDDFIFDGPRLLIAEDGANLAARSTPVAYVVRGQYWVNNHAHVIAASGRAELAYLASCVEHLDLSAFISGTAQPKLTRSNLDRLPIPLPPIALQRGFTDRLETLNRLRAAQARAGDHVQSLASVLQHRAFHGEL
jgi:type I restriction enzyme S subunit